MQIAPHMGITNIFRKNPQKSKLFLDIFSQGQIGGFRPVGHIGIFPIRIDNQLLDVKNRHAQTGMHNTGLLQTHFYQLGIHQFTDQGSGNKLEIGGKNRLFHCHTDLLRHRFIQIGLPEQSFRNSPPVPT